MIKTDNERIPFFISLIKLIDNMIGKMLDYLVLTEDKNKQNILENNKESLFLLLTNKKNCNLAKK